MDPPAVASDTSATAAEIESPSASENSRRKLKLGGTDAVNELQKSIDSAYFATPVAMAHLKDEFRAILLSITSAVKKGLLTDLSNTYTDSEYSSFSQEGINSNSEVNLIPNEAIHDLRWIADQMIESGYSRECIEVYASVRKAGVNESFKKLGIEKLSSKNIQRLEWYSQQEKIRQWIRDAKICIRVLFVDERRLSEQIFKGLGTNIDDVCFMETIKDSAILLFNFVGAISTSRKSPEKLFKILDLYKVLSDLLVDINTVFQSKSGEFIRKQAVEILFSLSDAAREILSEFEKAVFGEPTKVLISGGTIHPLTKCVMNYLDSMVDYKQTLIELIVSKPSTHSSELDSDFSEFEGHDSPLVLHLVWITKILKFNLKAKSKHYKDASLANFFMMNNVHYIVEKIKRSIELREMIGDDYLNKLTGEYDLAASNYLKTSWQRVLDSLRDPLQKLGRFLSGAVSKFVLRRRFKAFNAKFKEVLTNQATWFVADIQLREELRSSILQVLIPVYTSLLESNRNHIESGKHPQNYIKYSAEDVEKAVMNLFEGY